MKRLTQKYNQSFDISNFSSDNFSVERTNTNVRYLSEYGSHTDGGYCYSSSNGHVYHVQD